MRGRPIGPDRPQQTAEEPGDFHAAGALGWPQQGGHEPSIAVEHNDRLETVFVMMSVEQAKLLPAVNGIERVVQIEHNALRHPGVGGAIEIDERLPHTLERTKIGANSPGAKGSAAKPGQAPKAEHPVPA
jgi:hypothetical protein